MPKYAVKSYSEGLVLPAPAAATFKWLLEAVSRSVDTKEQKEGPNPEEEHKEDWHSVMSNDYPHKNDSSSKARNYKYVLHYKRTHQDQIFC